jgi:hypothetical protein
MAFTRKSFYLVCIFSGIVIILVFLSFYGLNKTDMTKVQEVRELHVETEASKAPAPPQTNSSSETVITSTPVPKFSVNDKNSTSIIITQADVDRKNSASAMVAGTHYEVSTVQSTDHRKMVKNQSMEYDNLSLPIVVGSASPIVLNSTSESARVTSHDTETSEQWSEPELKKITATVSFPQTKTYKLGETFMVTLVVINGENPAATLKATRSLGIKENTSKTETPLMTVSREMKAILMYAGKKVDSGDTEIQRVSSKQATTWTWDVTPDSPGRHYMRIILTAQVPNNKPDFSKPFIYKLTVTEDLWSHIQRVLAKWLTPQWISVDWLWKSILLPIALFVLWQVRARWRAHQRKKKMAQKNEQTSR